MNPSKRGTSRSLMTFALVTAGLTGLMPLHAQELPLLRKDISALTLSTPDGSSRSVRDLAKHAPHAFLFLPASLPSADCKFLLDEVERVRSFGLPVTFVSSGPDKICASPSTLRASKQFDALIRDAATSATACQAVVVDAGGSVRMHLRFEPSPSTVRSAAGDLIAWIALRAPGWRNSQRLPFQCRAKGEAPPSPCPSKACAQRDLELTARLLMTTSRHLTAESQSD